MLVNKSYINMISLVPLLALLPVTAYSNDIPKKGSLIKNYVNAPRYEPYGVHSVGYPQVCIRTNMPDERIDMEGLFKELSESDKITHPSQLLPAATQLAGSGNLGHVWTIFFDSETSWKSWSFRNPGTPTGNALYKNNWYDGPERKFNYQYCVSTKGVPTDDNYIVTNFVNPIVDESKHIASLMYPNVNFNNAVYSPATPCVWFATKLFNKFTGLDIPFEQKFDWNKIAKLLNEPSFENLKTIPDAGVVAESISKKIKFSLSYKTESSLFTHNNSYQYSYMDKFVKEKTIQSHTLFAEISPYYNNYKTALRHGSEVYFLDYQGNVSLFDAYSKSFMFENHAFKNVFGHVDFDPKMIKSSMPISKGMPHYSEAYNQYLIFLEDGDMYLFNAKTGRFTKNNYFEQYAPHLLPYVDQVLATTNVNDESIYVFLSGRKYIEVRISDFSIIDGEKPLDQHPELGKAFKLQ
ncbi:hypothetical protein ACX843_002247 [Vibrio cholerae]|nr:hypothetical protein [Vibrio cholerae]